MTREEAIEFLDAMADECGSHLGSQHQEKFWERYHAVMQALELEPIV